MRRKLLLKRWHGPALVLSLEMNSGGLPIAVYVAYRGNCTKVAIEHIRHASTLERLAHEEWEAILEDVIQGTTPPGKGHGPAEDPGDDMNEPERLPTVEEDDYEGLFEEPIRRRLLRSLRRQSQTLEVLCLLVVEL